VVAMARHAAKVSHLRYTATPLDSILVHFGPMVTVAFPMAVDVANYMVNFEVWASQLQELSLGTS
jgi:hypothetical protein